MVMQVTLSNTKNDIYQAYQEAVAEISKKEAEISRLKKEAGAAPKAAPSAAAPAKVAAADVPGHIGGVIHNLSGLSDGFGGAVSALSGTLTTEATRLAEIRAELAAGRKRLQEVHGIELGEKTLGQLLLDFQAKSEAAEKEQKEKQAAFELEMSAKRAAWKKEKDEQSARLKERNEELAKARKRESAEYKYEVDLQRKLDADKYAQEQKALQQDLDALQEAHSKGVEEREKALADREKAVAETKKKVEKLPQELEAAVKKAREEGVGIARKQAKTKSDLEAKDHDGRRRVYELRISTMEDAIGKQSTQIQNLSNQLNAALKQAQDLAVKAIEGASNASSFEAIREIAIEQAKNAQKAK